MKSAARAMLAVAGALLIGWGCGVKGHPVPPEQARPARIADLAAVSVANGVRLSWERPEAYEAGGHMRNLGGFTILRAHDTGPFEPLAEIPVTDQERFQVQRRFSYVDAEARLGQSYRYEIIATTTDGYRSRPSNISTITRAAPPRPPNPATFVLPTPKPLHIP